MKPDGYLQIKMKYNTLSEAQKKIADFILKDPEFILDNSISEVAIACKVGEATITRFCKALDFKSYHDFKLSIVRHLQEEENNGLIGGQITSDDSVSAVVKSILDQNIQALNETADLVHEEDILEAVDLLSESDRIVFFGVGSSMSAAMEGCNKFMRITPKASICLETHMQYVSASLLTERDVAVIVSHSGSTKEVVEIAEAVKNCGAKNICITRYIKSPLTQYSDVTLLCSSNERNVLGNSLSMEVTQVFLLDILYTEFFRRNIVQSQENKELSSAVLSGKLY